jgi:hypothetical protein
LLDWQLILRYHLILCHKNLFLAYIFPSGFGKTGSQYF